MIGKTVASMRRTLSCVPEGSCGKICEMAELTCKVSLAISNPQLKLMEISAEPRLVVERTSVTPGTRRTASSTGRVTSISICGAGWSPASSETTTRGKSTVGNNDTGNWRAAIIPAQASNPNRNRIALR